MDRFTGDAMNVSSPAHTTARTKPKNTIQQNATGPSYTQEKATTNTYNHFSLKLRKQSPTAEATLRNPTNLTEARAADTGGTEGPGAHQRHEQQTPEALENAADVA